MYFVFVVPILYCPVSPSSSAHVTCSHVISNARRINTLFTRSHPPFARMQLTGARFIVKDLLCCSLCFSIHVCKYGPPYAALNKASCMLKLQHALLFGHEPGHIIIIRVHQTVRIQMCVQSDLNIFIFRNYNLDSRNHISLIQTDILGIHCTFSLKPW